jgi:hypothetical protein
MTHVAIRRAGSQVPWLSLAALAALAALGACGGASKPAAPVIGAKGGAAVATAPCPPEAELAQALRARWALTDADVHTTCTPGRFPHAGWAISVVVDVSEDEAWDRIVVMAAGDRAVVAESEEHSIPPWARNEGYGGALFEVVDFDGDGVDELTTPRRREPRRHQRRVPGGPAAERRADRPDAVAADPLRRRRRGRPR